jgi:O-antigen ligase
MTASLPAAGRPVEMLTATPRRPPSLVMGTTAAAAILGAAGLAVLVRERPPPLGLVAAGGLAMVVVLALALVRLETVVFLGALLFPVVFVQPAPADGIFAIAIAVALVTDRMRLSRLPLGILALLGLLLATNLLSTVFAVDAPRAAQFLLITSYLVVFACWLPTYLDSEQRVRRLVVGFVAGGAASCVVGVLAYFLPIPERSLFLKFGRVRGLFEDPNVFGPFMVMISLLLLAELLEPRLLPGRRGTVLALFGISTMGVVFAFSRAAWLNAAVGVLTLLAVYSLRRRGGERAFYLVLTLAVAAAALAAVLVATHSVGFLEERAHKQSYDTDRFLAQRTGLDLVLQHPFGIGPGQFERFVSISAHSLYVRTLTEQGFLGLGVVVLLLFFTLALAVGNVLAGRDTYGIGSAPLLAAWIGLIANSAFVDTLHWRHLWLVAALIWTGAMRPSRVSVPPPARDNSARPLC